MTQSIPPVSSSNTPVTTSQEESPKSWWDTIVGFIFAEDEAAEPAEPFKEKKIMEIDPDALRQKRLVEEAVAARREQEKRIAAEKAAQKPAPAPKASPKVEVKVEVKPDPLPGIAVDAKMREVAQQRLDRLTSRLAAVRERLTSLERVDGTRTQQVQGLKTEMEKRSEALKAIRRGPRHIKERKEIKAQIEKFKEQIAALNTQLTASATQRAETQKEQVQTNAAVASAQKVIDLLKGKRVMPQKLTELQKAAESAELSLTKV